MSKDKDDKKDKKDREGKKEEKADKKEEKADKKEEKADKKEEKGKDEKKDKDEKEKKDKDEKEKKDKDEKEKKDKKDKADKAAAPADPMAAVLDNVRDPLRTDWEDAWVGMEPTFQSKKSVEKWRQLAAEGKAGEDAYFKDPYMLGTQREVAKAIAKRYSSRRAEKDEWCMFAQVEREEELDQWQVRRQNLRFEWADDARERFEVRFSLDPETFEYSIKPVPLAWFYDPRFVTFVDELLWKVPLKNDLSPSIAHGGAQFSISAKTFMRGSLLADDIADKLNHPELATFLFDWPNPDDRAFRATRDRFQAFRTIVEQYWAGGFHPSARGPLTVVDVLLARNGFAPAHAPPPGLMDQREGPIGSAREVFQTNFAFGRAVALRAQAVHPGYWQSAHPSEDGYRPDQIMRYSEGNLNRLQIAGEFHVKSGKVLNDERIPPASAPLDLEHLYEEASWENRGQMGRTSGSDFIEALLLDVHNARWLAKNPHVAVVENLFQDQLHGDAEHTLQTRAPEVLDKLKKEAVKLNREASRNRLHSDFIEPETLFWAAWKALPAGAQAEIAREAVRGLVERVERAASCDPRPEAAKADPMEWHRHRVHPVLWQALRAVDLPADDPAKRELDAFLAGKEKYLGRRPRFSHSDDAPPWDEPTL
jgi:hypothetical protein